MKQSYLTVSGTIFSLALAFAGQGCSSSSDTAKGTAGAAGAGTAGAGTAGAGTAGAGTAGAGTAGAGTAGAGTAGAGTAGSGGAIALCTTQTKSAACTMEGEVCNKTCGPQSSGFKTETCTNALYAEGDCMFDCSDTTKDWACYALSTATACDTTVVPQASQPCTVPNCMPCTGGYLDSNANPKTGACVCVSGANGGKWSCASTSAWPTCVP
jgi:hypothetical protein